MTDPYGNQPPPYGGLPPAPPAGPYGALERGPRPQTVTNAVRLMLVRVGIGVLSLVVLFATKDDLKQQILNETPNADESLVDSAIKIGAVIGLVFLVLYALLAMQVAKGRNWARVTTWVLAGIGVLSTLAGFAQAASGFSRVLSIVDLALDIAIIVLLAMGPSNRYFKPARY